MANDKRKYTDVLMEINSLLARFDERTANTWTAIEKIEKHQGEQNGIIREIIREVSANTEGRKQQGKSIGRLWKIVIAVPSGGSVLAGVLKVLGIY